MMPSEKLTIGFAYDSPVDDEDAGAGSVSCEYEDNRTIEWLYGCLCKLGDVVLLKGINDEPSVMKELVRGLVRSRVRPYYIYQAQTLKGTSHFITPVEKGIEIIESLRGHTTGFVVPVYLLDTPYGKIPMNPETKVRRKADAVYLRSWSGEIWREPNKRE